MQTHLLCFGPCFSKTKLKFRCTPRPTLDGSSVHVLRHLWCRLRSCIEWLRFEVRGRKPHPVNLLRRPRQLFSTSTTATGVICAKTHGRQFSSNTQRAMIGSGECHAYNGILSTKRRGTCNASKYVEDSVSHIWKVSQHHVPGTEWYYCTGMWGVQIYTTLQLDALIQNTLHNSGSETSNFAAPFGMEHQSLHRRTSWRPSKEELPAGCLRHRVYRF